MNETAAKDPVTEIITLLRMGNLSEDQLSAIATVVTDLRAKQRHKLLDLAHSHNRYKTINR